MLKDTITAALSVAEYLDQLNDMLATTYGRVSGEVCAVKVWNSGHVYFTLKDQTENAVLPCVMWRGKYAFFGVELEDGMEVVLEGRPEVYAPSGRLSFITESISLVGEGALMKRYLALKKKLGDEGLFDEARKRPLPEFPSRIGIITSLHGAVIHDFSNNLRPFGFKVEICHSAVEGVVAAKELVAAMRTFKKRDPELLVIMRGGGSMESLAGFDNEILTREIADFPVPVIAAIGHHKDVPLAALAADLAVSTPTAAAHAISEQWTRAVYTLDSAQNLVVNSYARSLAQTEQRVVRMTQTIHHAMNMVITRFDALSSFVQSAFRSIQHRISTVTVSFASQTRLVLQVYRRALEEKQTVLNHTERVVALNDPHRQLRLGYNIARRDGKIIRSVDDVRIGDDVQLTISDGMIDTSVTRTHA